MRKIVSSLVLAAFLVNTTLTDLAFARPQGESLNVASLCDDLIGIQHKDMGLGAIALEEQLMRLAKRMGGELPSDIELLKEAWSRMSKEELTSLEETVYTPSPIQFFPHEIEETVLGPCIRFEIADSVSPDDDPRIYRAIFTTRRDGELNGYPILPFTEEEFDAYGRFKKDVPRRKRADAEAIARYVEHERIIDAWIARHMTVEGGSIDLSRLSVPGHSGPGHASTVLFDQIFSLDDDHGQAFRDLNNLPKDFDYWMMSACDESRLIFIRVPATEELPVITIGGKAVPVTGHSSAYASYCFLDEGSFDLLRKKLEGREKLSPEEQAAYAVLLGEKVIPLVIHEYFGVRYGFDWELAEDGRIVNDLDRAYAALVRAAQDPAYRDTDDFSVLTRRAADHIVSREARPVDLNTSLISRDYLQGLPDEGHEDARMALLLGGLFRKSFFTVSDYLEVREKVRNEALIAGYVLAPLAGDPQDAARRELDALSGKGFLRITTTAAEELYSPTGIFALESYQANFRIFANLAPYAGEHLDFGGVLYLPGEGLVCERQRARGLVRESVAFDPATGAITIVEDDSRAKAVTRCRIGLETVAVYVEREGAEKTSCECVGSHLISNLIAMPDGELVMRVNKRLYDEVLLAGMSLPLVQIASDESRLTGGEFLASFDPEGVALSRPASGRDDLRDDGGRFAVHPGKNADAVLQVIALNPSLWEEPFSVTDLLAAYQEVPAELGFEPLAARRPDSTMRRDVQKLVEQKYLKPASRRGEYTLTKKGHDRIDRELPVLKDIVLKDLETLLPPELLEAVDRDGQKLVVGVPTEIKPYAERVGITPEGVRLLVSFGVRVLVQKGAGNVHFSDDAYRRAGAFLVDTAEEIWQKADIIKKVKEPLDGTVLKPDLRKERTDRGIRMVNELDLMRPGQIVFTYLHLASPDCKDLTYALHRKNVTGIGFETIVIDRDGRKVTPALEPMSIIAGNLGGYFGAIFERWSEIIEEGGKKVVRLTDEGREMMARLKADYLNAKGFRQAAKGKKAVVLGGGVSGLRMAKTLLKEGATVTITDVSPARVAELERILSIYGERARVLPVSDRIDGPSEELLASYKEADILGGCILLPGDVAPRMSRELLAEISAAKPKTIVDIAIDQGGNFYGAHSTYYSDPVFVDEFGNKRFCVANMPDFVGGVASVELEKTTIAHNLALALGFDQAIDLFPELKGGVNVHGANLYNKKLTDMYDDIPPASFPRDRFDDIAIQVPKDHHPDMEVVQARGLLQDRVSYVSADGRRLYFYPNDRLVPTAGVRPRSGKEGRVFTVAELFETGTLGYPAEKLVVVPDSDAMTHVSGDVLTSVMDAASYLYNIGLATGGTTEALRKLMGLEGLLESTYGRSIDPEKIKKICTLDNYYFEEYLKRRGLSQEEADYVLEISSYENEQLYMMIRNMMQGLDDWQFVAPPTRTDLDWFAAADHFREMLQRHFVVETYLHYRGTFVNSLRHGHQLWQLHGIGTDSHDAFNEIFVRMVDTSILGSRLIRHRTGEVRHAYLPDGTDLAAFGLEHLPPSGRIPARFASMPVLRDAHASHIHPVTQVQNAGHFTDPLHPFFLRLMGDSSAYDWDELIARILSMTPEELLRYSGDPKYHFRDMAHFVRELNTVIAQYTNVPYESITRGTGDILDNGSMMLPDGAYPLQLFMSCAVHKQLATLRAVLAETPGELELSTAAAVLRLAKNAILVATHESLQLVYDRSYDTIRERFIAIEPDAAGLDDAVQDAWEETPEGVRMDGLEKQHAQREEPAPAKTIELSHRLRGFMVGDLTVTLALGGTAWDGTGLVTAVTAYLNRHGCHLENLIKTGDRTVRYYRNGRFEDRFMANLLDTRNGHEIGFKIIRVDLETEAREVIAEGHIMEADPAAIPPERVAIEGAVAAVSDGLAIPTHPVSRYTLLVDHSFCPDKKELEADAFGYMTAAGMTVAAGDRFVIDQVNGADIENILSHVQDPARTVVQVSTAMSESDLARLRDEKPGIRIVRVNPQDFAMERDRIADRLERQKNRFDMYAAMLAVRRITEEESRDETSEAYRAIAFYLVSHFVFDGGVTVDDYIKAIVHNDLAGLLKGILTYRPAERYQVPEYNTVAATLISA